MRENTSLPEVLNLRREQALRQGLKRELKEPSGIDFASNDYLGFARDPNLHDRMIKRVRDIPVGSRGSRLLSGHTALFSKVEENLARFSGKEAALLYPSGYQANVGLLSALLGPGDAVYSDALNHASIIDGVRLSGAEKYIYRHCDLEHLEALLKESASSFRVIVTESVFSMEGDLAPLPEISALAKRHGAHLILDEAHSTGIPSTRWPRDPAIETLATLHTGGKALGVAGAWVAGSQDLKQYLIQFSRSQIYSTAPSPWLVAALDEAVLFWKEQGEERAARMIENMRTLSGDPHWIAPIFPYLCGTEENAVRLATEIQRQGFDVRAIRPPTVPEGRSRLRLSCPWGRSASEIARLRQWIGGAS